MKETPEETDYAETPEEAEEESSGPSHLMFGLTILYLGMMFIVGPALDGLLGHGVGIAVFVLLFIGINIGFLWSAFSRKSYEHLRQSYPQLRRENWILNVVLQDVLVPSLVVALLFYFAARGAAA